MVSVPDNEGSKVTETTGGGRCRGGPVHPGHDRLTWTISCSMAYTALAPRLRARTARPACAATLPSSAQYRTACPFCSGRRDHCPNACPIEMRSGAVCGPQSSASEPSRSPPQGCCSQPSPGPVGRPCCADPSGVRGLIRSVRALVDEEPMPPSSRQRRDLRDRCGDGADKHLDLNPMFRAIGLANVLAPVAVFAVGVAVWCPAGSRVPVQGHGSLSCDDVDLRRSENVYLHSSRNCLNYPNQRFWRCIGARLAALRC